MSPLETMYWLEALESLQHQERWWNTPRRWFFGNWYWGVWHGWSRGIVSDTSEES